MKRLIIATAAVAAVMSGCKKNECDVTLLYSTPWVLESVVVENESMQMPVNSPVLIFTDSAAVNGTGGCNHFFGSYEANSDGTITVNTVGMTRMLCPDASFEDKYIDILGGVTAFEVTESSLILKHGEKNARMSYVPYVASGISAPKSRTLPDTTGRLIVIDKASVVKD